MRNIISYIFIGIIILIAMIILLKQKEKDSIYMKSITSITKDKNMQKVIHIFFIILLIIISILLISLEVSIVHTGFNNGWLDRDTMITSIATLIGGFGGLIGSIIAVVGTFTLFKYQYTYQKEEDDKINKNIIEELIEHTIKETDILIEFIIDRCIKHYVIGFSLYSETEPYKILKAKIKGADPDNGIKTGYGDDIKFTFKFSKQTVEHLVECFGFSSELFELYDKSLITKYGEEYTIDCDNVKIESTADLIINKFIEVKEESGNIVYYDDWNKCLYGISNMEFDKRKNIALWLNMFSRTIGKYNENRKYNLIRIDELNKEIEYLNRLKRIKRIRDIKRDIEEIKKASIGNMALDDSMTGNVEEVIKKLTDEKNTLEQSVGVINAEDEGNIEDIKKLQNLKPKRDYTILESEKQRKDIMYHICSFIKYRDEVIKILNDEKNKDIRTSKEILNEKFDNIKINSTNMKKLSEN